MGDKKILFKISKKQDTLGFTWCKASKMSLLKHLNAAHRENPKLSEYKSECCMKFTVESQCRRCPFRQISDPGARDLALHECWDKRRGTYEWNGIKIAFRNQYR